MSYEPGLSGHWTSLPPTQLLRTALRVSAAWLSRRPVGTQAPFAALLRAAGCTVDEHARSTPRLPAAAGPHVRAHVCCGGGRRTGARTRRCTTLGPAPAWCPTCFGARPRCPTARGSGAGLRVHTVSAIQAHVARGGGAGGRGVSGSVCGGRGSRAPSQPTPPAACAPAAASTAHRRRTTGGLLLPSAPPPAEPAPRPLAASHSPKSGMSRLERLKGRQPTNTG